MIYFRSTLAQSGGGGEPVDLSEYQISVNGELQGFGARQLHDLTFNQPVSIGNKIVSCSSLFASCTQFNQPVTIPDSVIDCYRMFYACANFNQPITIPNNVTNCDEMFYSCRNLNQPVTIPDGATNCNCYRMFFQCYNFNQPVIISSGVASCYEMLQACNNFGSNIYIKRTNADSFTATGMLFGKNNQRRVNIHFNSALNNYFNKSTSVSIVEASITWTAMTNGFYNAAYNIYCYNNYSV